MEQIIKKNHFYANRVFVSSSPYDVILDFQINVPKITDHEQKPEMEIADSSTIILSHSHFKAFVKVLNKQLENMEETMGEIKVFDPLNKNVNSK
jgi:hypothetical protein